MSNIKNQHIDGLIKSYVCIVELNCSECMQKEVLDNDMDEVEQAEYCFKLGWRIKYEFLVVKARGDIPEVKPLCPSCVWNMKQIQKSSYEVNNEIRNGYT